MPRSLRRRLRFPRAIHRVLAGAVLVAALALILTPASLPVKAQEEVGPNAVLQVTPTRGPVERNFLGDAARSQGALVDGGPERAAIVLYEWDWRGTGEFVEGGATERHRFDEEGVYEVTVRVTDETGATDTATRTVTVAEVTRTWRWDVVTDNLGWYLEGAQITLYVSVIAIIAGLPLGIVFGLLRITRFTPIRWLAGAYIEFLRGTPLLVQIFIIVFGLPELGIRLGALTGGIVALTINTSAYQAEIIRSGIQAIPRGQMEAATAMGMTYAQSMRFVVLPQALRLVIPPLTNEFIILIKDSSLVSVIGILELMGVGRAIGSRTFRYFEALIAVAVMYFVMTYSLSLFLQWVERKLAIPGMGVHTPKGEH